MNNLVQIWKYLLNSYRVMRSNLLASHSFLTYHSLFSSKNIFFHQCLLIISQLLFVNYSIVISTSSKYFMVHNQRKKCIIRKDKKGWIRWSRFPEDVLPSPQQNHSKYISHHVYTSKYLFLYFFLNHFLSFSLFLYFL